MLATFWTSTEQLSTALRWLTILGILSTAAFGAAAYFVNDRIGVMQGLLIEKQGVRIEKQSEMVGTQTRTISEQIDHIVQLSNELTAVKQQADQLARKAQNSERDISDTYDFNGVHRQKLGGGRSSSVAGPETAVFGKIKAFEESQNWGALKDLCEAQIKATPTWLTPYLFAGIALANIGDFAGARDRLNYVVSKAGDDLEYSDAARLLTEIASRTKE